MKKLLLILLCLPLISFGQNIVWESDFSDPNDWVLDNNGQNPPNYGWSIDQISDGWWSPNGITSTSGGNFAELSNGDPTQTPGTQADAVVYTMTMSQPANIFDSIGSGNATLSFEEYGAKFYDLQEIQVSTDGINFVTVGDNSAYSQLTQSGGSAYPNPSLREINLASYIGSTPTSVWIRFSWTSNLNLPTTDPNYYNTWVVYGWYIDDVVIYDPTSGCMDSLACNYNPLAITDDGSCNSSSSTFFTAANCNSYTWYVNGNTYVNSGLYTSLSTNSFGCDHIDTLDLTINNSTSSTDTHIACDEFMWYCDGNTYTASNNTATYTYTNSAGCDSTVTLDLTINNSTSNTTTESACDSYTWPIDGNTYTTSGTYTNISTNNAGCYHTETLNLTINNSTSNTTTESACDSYTWPIDGNTYTTSGTYTNISTNNAGCYHTETLNLTINNLPTANIWQTGDELFAITPPNVSVVADWYNIQIQDGLTRIWLIEEQSTSFEPTFDCSYFIVIEDENKCIDTSSIFYYSASANRIGSFITSPNPTSGLINVKFENPKNQFVMFELISNNGSKLSEFITIENNLDIDLSKYPPGSYYLYFNSEDAVQGCRLEEVQKVSTKIILNK